MATSAPIPIRFGDLRDELPRFRDHLEAERKSPRTVESYAESAAQLAAFLVAHGMPTQANALRREHVEAYLRELGATGRSPATIALRYRSLRVLFGWLADEGEIETSPMARMRPPQVAVHPVPVLSVDDMRALLRKCAGTEFGARRDTALALLLYDTGARLSEIAGLSLEDLDFVQKVAIVTGKGGSRRALPYSPTVARALDRYLRVRHRRPDAASGWLWLGKRGRLEARGIVQALKRRAAAAGRSNARCAPF